MTDRSDIQFKIRLSPAMKERLETAAYGNRRSISAEIVARLEKTLEDDDYLGELEKRIEKLEERVDAHDYHLGARDPYNGPR